MTYNTATQNTQNQNYEEQKQKFIGNFLGDLPENFEDLQKKFPKIIRTFCEVTGINAWGSYMSNYEKQESCKPLLSAPSNAYQKAMEEKISSSLYSALEEAVDDNPAILNIDPKKIIATKLITVIDKYIKLRKSS